MFLKSVDVASIREVRQTNRSRDFDKHVDDIRQINEKRCLVILHGNEFKLKTLSLVGMLKYIYDQNILKSVSFFQSILWSLSQFICSRKFMSKCVFNYLKM